MATSPSSRVTLAIALCGANTNGVASAAANLPPDATTTPATVTTYAPRPSKQQMPS